MKALKQILCIIIGGVLIFSATAPVFASGEIDYTELNKTFWDYCHSNMPHVDGEETEVNITDAFKSEDIIIFAADSWEEADHGRHRRMIGDWDVESYQTHAPYDMGIYVLSNNSVYTLEEALAQNIVTDLSPVNNFDGRRTAHIDGINRCIEAFLEYKRISTSDEMRIDCTVFGNIGNYTVFRADIESNNDEPDMNSEQVIGDFIFAYSNPNGPEDNPTGLYVLLPDGNVISALEAYEQNLVTDAELAEIAKGEPYNKYDPYNQYKYEEIIIPKVMEENIFDESTEITSYREIYEYYSDTSTADEATPDYVLIDLSTNLYYAMPVADILGDLLLAGSSGNIPFTYGYAVYIPETDEIYDLTHALTLDIEGIENTLNHIGFIARMGDTDGDKKLTIKDATYLQKCLAGLESFGDDDDISGYFSESESKVYISDYNRDGVRNIRDATAIQKKLAKITE